MFLRHGISSFFGSQHTGNYDTRWYYQEPVYTYYFYKDTQMESATSSTDSDISNIRKWVKSGKVACLSFKKYRQFE